MLVSYFFSCLSFWASLTQVFTLSVFFLFLFFVFCFLFFVFCFLFFVLLRQVLIYGNWRKSNYHNGSCNFLPFTINNGNRTKWSPIRTVIIRVIIKIVDLSITSTITDRIGRNQFLLQINNRYNFRKKIHLGQTSLVKTMSKVRNSSILEIPQFTFFFQDKWLLLWLLWSILWLVDLAEWT